MLIESKVPLSFLSIAEGLLASESELGSSIYDRIFDDVSGAQAWFYNEEEWECSEENFEVTLELAPWDLPHLPLEHLRTTSNESSSCNLTADSASSSQQHANYSVESESRLHDRDGADLTVNSLPLIEVMDTSISSPLFYIGNHTTDIPRGVTAESALEGASLRQRVAFNRSNMQVPVLATSQPISAASFGLEHTTWLLYAAYVLILLVAAGVTASVINRPLGTGSVPQSAQTRETGASNASRSTSGHPEKSADHRAACADPSAQCAAAAAAGSVPRYPTGSACQPASHVHTVNVTAAITFSPTLVLPATTAVASSAPDATARDTPLVVLAQGATKPARTEPTVSSKSPQAETTLKDSVDDLGGIFSRRLRELHQRAGAAASADARAVASPAKACESECEESEDPVPAPAIVVADPELIAPVAAVAAASTPTVYAPPEPMPFTAEGVTEVDTALAGTDQLAGDAAAQCATSEDGPGVLVAPEVPDDEEEPSHVELFAWSSRSLRAPLQPLQRPGWQVTVASKQAAAGDVFEVRGNPLARPTNADRRRAGAGVVPAAICPASADAAAPEMDGGDGYGSDGDGYQLHRLERAVWHRSLAVSRLNLRWLNRDASASGAPLPLHGRRTSSTGSQGSLSGAHHFAVYRGASLRRVPRYVPVTGVSLAESASVAVESVAAAASAPYSAESEVAAPALQTASASVATSAGGDSLMSLAHDHEAAAGMPVRPEVNRPAPPVHSPPQSPAPPGAVLTTASSVPPVVAVSRKAGPPRPAGLPAPPAGPRRPGPPAPPALTPLSAPIPAAVQPSAIARAAPAAADEPASAASMINAAFAGGEGGEPASPAILLARLRVAKAVKPTAAPAVPRPPVALASGGAMSALMQQLRKRAAAPTGAGEEDEPANPPAPVAALVSVPAPTTTSPPAVASAPSVNLHGAEPELALKFARMLKMGVPAPAVRIKMGAEGLPPTAVEAVLASWKEIVQHAAGAPPAPTEGEADSEPAAAVHVPATPVRTPAPAPAPAAAPSPSRLSVSQLQNMFRASASTATASPAGAGKAGVASPGGGAGRIQSPFLQADAGRSGSTPAAGGASSAFRRPARVSLLDPKRSQNRGLMVQRHFKAVPPAALVECLTRLVGRAVTAAGKVRARTVGLSVHPRNSCIHCKRPLTSIAHVLVTGSHLLPLQAVDMTPDRARALAKDLAIEPAEMDVIRGYAGEPAALAEVRGMRVLPDQGKLRPHLY